MIEVQRQPKVTHVTNKIEDFLLEIFNSEPEVAYHQKELLTMIRMEYSHEFGWELEAHVARALDKHHCNNFIKRVAPATFESINGPDEIYSERETGHMPEGETVHRPFNVHLREQQNKFRSQKEFNEAVRKTESSVGILRLNKMTDQQISDSLIQAGFNHLIVKKVLRLPKKTIANL